MVDQEDYSNFNLYIDGPKGSPYEGGVFTVNVQCSNDYPKKCPQIKMVTKIHHLNIDSNTGEVSPGVIEE